MELNGDSSTCDILSCDCQVLVSGIKGKDTKASLSKSHGVSPQAATDIDDLSWRVNTSDRENTLNHSLGDFWCAEKPIPVIFQQYVLNDWILPSPLNLYDSSLHQKRSYQKHNGSRLNCGPKARPLRFRRSGFARRRRRTRCAQTRTFPSGLRPGGTPWLTGRKEYRACANEKLK